MHSLSTKVWTFPPRSEEPKPVGAAQIRRTEQVHDVATFKELVVKVATLGHLNRRLFLLFRGQERHYSTMGGYVSLYPSIYRDGKTDKTLKKDERRDRFDKLELEAERLLDDHPKHSRATQRELGHLRRHPELQWAILQHYLLAETPYLDLTSSLRVAASFALLRDEDVATEGLIYVLGLPYPTGTITHAVDEDVKLVRLQAACPPSAKRPHFQEGFLAGSCHVDRSEPRSRHNLSRRLVATFRIVAPSSFWSPGRFDPIPRDALYPEDDEGFSWLGE